MGKKNTLSLGKKVGIGIAATVVIAIGASQAYAAISGNEDFELKSFLHRLQEIKNEPSGCCLPLCSAMGKTECGQRSGNEENPNWQDKKCSRIEECKVGCCQVDCVVKELAKASCEHMEGYWTAGACKTGCCDSESGKQELPQKTCEECTGGSWSSGSCKPTPTPKESGAYSFHGEYEITVPLEGYENASATFKTTIDMTTCQGKYDGWSGTKKDEMTMETKYGTQHKVLGENPFSPGDNTFEVSGNTLKLRGIGPKGAFVTEGPITSGGVCP